MTEAVAISRDTQEPQNQFVAFAFPPGEEQERRRDEARMIVAALLARHILAQRRGTSDDRIAA